MGCRLTQLWDTNFQGFSDIYLPGKHLSSKLYNWLFQLLATCSSMKIYTYNTSWIFANPRNFISSEISHSTIYDPLEIQYLKLKLIASGTIGLQLHNHHINHQITRQVNPTGVTVTCNIHMGNQAYKYLGKLSIDKKYTGRDFYITPTTDHPGITGDNWSTY